MSVYNRRSRIRQALTGKLRSSSTKEFLGKDIGTCRKWVENHFSPQMNRPNIDLFHVKPIGFFEVSTLANWKYTQPLSKQDHQEKGNETIF